MNGEAVSFKSCPFIVMLMVRLSVCLRVMATIVWQYHNRQVSRNTVDIGIVTSHRVADTLHFARCKKYNKNKTINGQTFPMSCTGVMQLHII